MAAETHVVGTNVRRGDTVVVIAGKEKGKKGRVLRLLSKKHRVVIERINLVKRHTRATQANPKGGIIEKEGSVELSNVALWCPKCGAGRRAKAHTKDGQKKQRACVKCGTVFEAA
jgi:large subunit ribosomal protein L24